MTSSLIEGTLSPGEDALEFEYFREAGGRILVSAEADRDELRVLRSPLTAETGRVFAPVADYIAEHDLIKISEDSWMNDLTMAGSAAVRSTWRAA